jgi:hypothetical protein
VRVSLLDLAVALVVGLLFAGALGLLGGGGDGLAPAAILPDPAITPGVLNPDVTQETIGSTICVRGWTSTVRPPSSYTSELKRRMMDDLGRTGPMSDYQLDHFISLRLGGHPTDPRNLWPRPYPHQPESNRQSEELHRKVCSGDLSLHDAQRREAELKHRYG